MDGVNGRVKLRSAMFVVRRADDSTAASTVSSANSCTAAATASAWLVYASADVARVLRLFQLSARQRYFCGRPSAASGLRLVTMIATTGASVMRHIMHRSEEHTSEL